jgi:hypothetical protein
MADTNSTRPLSASGSKNPSRPRSALANFANADQIIKDIENQIRSVSKLIKLHQREKILRETRPTTATSEGKTDERPLSRYSRDEEHDLPNNDPTVDPIPGLEEQRHRLLQKYEQLTKQEYSPSPDALVYDFCELYFNEFEQKQRSTLYLSKYYDPDAHLNIVGYKAFNKREVIIDKLLVSFNFFFLL